MCQTTPLQLEQLEDRVVPTLYVITHGFTLEGTAPEWAFDMGSAIDRRNGFTAVQNEVRHDATNLGGPAPAGFDEILIFNWAGKAGNNSEGNADDDDVAGTLARAVQARYTPGAPLDIHFIGHSRGVYVNLAAIQRLGDVPEIGRLQMTTLDPEFLDGPGKKESQPLEVPSFVDYADNYYQRIDPGIAGDPDGFLGGGIFTTGAVNVNLSEPLSKWNGREPGFFQPAPTHIEVHDWYHWTIDTDDRDVATVRYRDDALNTQQDTFLSNPAQGRDLLFSQKTDLDIDGVSDDPERGDNIGFHYSIGEAFGPRSFAGFNGLDLVFVIDTTASMSDDIDNVKKAAREIIQTVKATVPDSQIALVTYRDLPESPFGASTDYQSRVEIGFTRNLDAVQAAIDAIEVAGGADEPESVFSGLATAIDASALGGWRGGTIRKSVILMGDAPAHDPEPGTGLTKEAITIRAFNADPVDIFPVLVEDDNDASSLFRSLADLNGGKAFQADSADDVVGALVDAITEIGSDIRPEVELFAVGAGAGGSPRVTVYNPDGTVRFDFFAFDPNFAGGVHVATGDVNGDGFDDIVVAAGAGGGPHVKVFDGNTGEMFSEFFAYDANFAGGVFVTVGDLNGDGFGDVITGAGAGGGPHVRAFGGAGDGIIADFFAYDAAFLGGVRVASGDINGDGFDNIITGAGAGGGPHVRAFGGAGLLADFFAYDANFTGGVYVAVGDVDGNGFADIITGAGAGGGPHVRAFGGAGLLADFFAYDGGFAGGTRVTSSDRDGDGSADIIVGPGPGGGPNVRIFDADPFEQIDSFFAFGDAFAGGLLVG